jgi:hypothetical protein
VCEPGVNDEKTLITDAEKADAIAHTFAESHNKTMISPLRNMVRASVLCFKVVVSTPMPYTSPREIKGFVKKTEKRQGF